MAAGGVAALAVGAFFTAVFTEKIASASGFLKISGGLFTTALWPLFGRRFLFVAIVVFWILPFQAREGAGSAQGQPGQS